MWYRFSIVATAALLLGGPGAAAAELPTYEVMGFPITQHQLADCRLFVLADSARLRLGQCTRGAIHSSRR